MVAVTISSPHGVGTTAIARALGQVLDLPVLDRAIPFRVARNLAVPLAEALAHDERVAGGIGGLLARYAQPLASVGGPVAAWPADISEDAFRDQTEQVIREAVASSGAIVIGRAGVFVLGERPDVLHVRLTGPEPERITRVIERGAISAADARRRVRETDHAREVYVRHFYRRRWDDPAAFHLVVTATAFSAPTCVALIATAARGRFHRGV